MCESALVFINILQIRTNIRLSPITKDAMKRLLQARPPEEVLFVDMQSRLEHLFSSNPQSQREY